MSIEEVLKLNRREALKHIDILDAKYYELTGTRVCRVCPSDISYMLQYLTNKIMNNTQFKLREDRTIYKLQKGSPKTINNDRMTDDLALEFIALRPERIRLFSEYPENYQEMLPQVVDEVIESEEAPCKPCVRAKLESMKMQELKEEYPNVPVEFGQKKSDFIDKIINTL